MSPPVVEVTDLKKHFPIRKGLLRRLTGHVHAVDGVSFSIGEAETVALVGESGCGKSTVGRTLLRLIDPTAGSVKINGAEITGLNKREMRPYRRQMQIVFQDPYASLNPRMRVGDIIGEPLKVHGLAKGKALAERVEQLLDRVGLRPQQARNFPHEFSGGQRQRIAIARAMALEPKFVLLDEPTSALDMSVQAQIVDLLRDLQQRHGLGYMFISHDLKVVKALATDIIVMRNGKVVEQGAAIDIFAAPQSDYTRALFAAAFKIEAVDPAAVAQ
jgi:ABC-type microcin C transport system duplicated ATPase subunit YejF